MCSGITPEARFRNIRTGITKNTLFENLNNRERGSLMRQSGIINLAKLTDTKTKKFLSSQNFNFRFFFKFCLFYF